MLLISDVTDSKAGPTFQGACLKKSSPAKQHPSLAQSIIVLVDSASWGHGGVMRGRARAWLLSFRGVVDDVEATAAGRNDICDELGAFGANVSQSAACDVEVRKLVFDGTAGQRAQRPETHTRTIRSNFLTLNIA